jgi:hypothetical protein
MEEKMFFEKFGIVFEAKKLFTFRTFKVGDTAISGCYVKPGLTETATELDYLALQVAYLATFGPACGIQRNSWGILIDGKLFHVEIYPSDGYKGTDEVHIGGRPYSSDHEISEKIFLAVKAGKTVEKRDLTAEDMAELEQYRTAWPTRLNGIDASAHFYRETRIVNVAGHGYVGMPWNTRPAPQTDYSLPEFVKMVNSQHHEYGFKNQLHWLVRNGYLVKNGDGAYEVA